MRAEVNFNWIKPDMSEEKIHLSFAEPVNITRIYQDESIEVYLLWSLYQTPASSVKGLSASVTPGIIMCSVVHSHGW